MKMERMRRLNTQDYQGGPILYWMDREMRLHHNWALNRALELGNAHDQPVGIVYNLVADYLGGGQRQLPFKREGLHELAQLAEEKGLPFCVLLTDKSERDVLAFIQEQNVGYVVTDMNPLRLNQRWKQRIASQISVPMEEVDAHNIVPVWVTSEKQEFAARTIRPKIHRHLPDYLEAFPNLRTQSRAWRGFPKTDWKTIDALEGDLIAPAVSTFTGGETAARRQLKRFVDTRLNGYATKRNDPNEDHLSGLSPYFHYGMLSPQFAALEVRAADAPRADRDVFIEEAVVRRELSDNFCFYNTHYDQFEGFPAWAQKTLNEHRSDSRAYVYSKRQFAQAQTHDPLWNAAQQEMLQTGKMHGYMRMYWAKKILEWTKSPEDALRIAIYLNDTFELDGRDPNGYVGVAWSIGGVHDRAWNERPVFGKVRYMNFNGCKRKFDVQAYMDRWLKPTLL